MNRCSWLGAALQSRPRGPEDPFIRWLVDCYETRPESFFPVSATRLSSMEAHVAPGRYAYSVHLRSFAGLRRDITIGFRATGLPDGEVLGEEASERLVMAAARAGRDFANAASRLDLAQLVTAVRACDQVLLESYEHAVKEFRAENEYRCNVQQESAQQFRDRRVAELRARIERFQRDGRTNMIPPTEGLIRRLDDELSLKRHQIAARRAVDESLQFLAVGFIEVA